MKWRSARLLLSAALVVGLSGCVGVTLSGAADAVRASERAELLPAAVRGDAEAEYRLGLSYCCTMGPRSSTQMATEWLCRSARQGYPAAQYELGRIYAGETSRARAPGRKPIRVVTVNRDLSQAQAWFALAAANGHEEAAARADDLAAGMSVTERAAAEALRADWRRIPCVYDEVFSQDA